MSVWWGFVTGWCRSVGGRWVLRSFVIPGCHLVVVLSYQNGNPEGEGGQWGKWCVGPKYHPRTSTHPSSILGARHQKKGMALRF